MFGFLSLKQKNQGKSGKNQAKPRQTEKLSQTEKSSQNQTKPV